MKWNKRTKQKNQYDRQKNSFDFFKIKKINHLTNLKKNNMLN